jgi:hypothetical protein
MFPFIRLIFKKASTHLEDLFVAVGSDEGEPLQEIRWGGSPSQSFHVFLPNVPPAVHDPHRNGGST